MVLLWQPPSYFSQWSLSSFVVDDVSYSRKEQYMMTEKARHFQDHRAVEPYALARPTRAKTHRSRRA